MSLGDARRIRIHGTAFIIDTDLPTCAAGRIGAHHGAFIRQGVAVRPNPAGGQCPKAAEAHRQPYHQWPTLDHTAPFPLPILCSCCEVFSQQPPDSLPHQGGIRAGNDGLTGIFFATAQTSARVPSRTEGNFLGKGTWHSHHHHSGWIPATMLGRWRRRRSSGCKAFQA